MTPPLVIHAAGRPVPKGRPRGGQGRSQRAFRTDDRTRAAESALAWQARAAMLAAGHPGFAAARVEVRIVLTVLPGFAADVDNVTKLVLDGLQKGGVYLNDRQVHRLVVDREDTAGSESMLITILDWRPRVSP